MYIFSERGDQELSKTVSIMFIRHAWTILQYLEVSGVFSGIEYPMKNFFDEKTFRSIEVYKVNGGQDFFEANFVFSKFHLWVF